MTERDLRMWTDDWMATVMAPTVAYLLECIESRDWQRCATVMGTTAAVIQAALNDDRGMLDRADKQLAEIARSDE